MTALRKIGPGTQEDSRNTSNSSRDGFCLAFRYTYRWQRRCTKDRGIEGILSLLRAFAGPCEMLASQSGAPRRRGFRLAAPVATVQSEHREENWALRGELVMLNLMELPSKGAIFRWSPPHSSTVLQDFDVPSAASFSRTGITTGFASVTDCHNGSRSDTVRLHRRVGWKTRNSCTPLAVGVVGTFGFPRPFENRWLPVSVPCDSPLFTIGNRSVHSESSILSLVSGLRLTSLAAVQEAFP